jgi:hypothetical protein
MALVRASTTLKPTGSINANTSPPTITTPTCVAGDLLLVAVFWAQASGLTTMFTPAGMTMVSIPGTNTNRQGAIFAAVVDNPADFSAGISLRSGFTATRVAAVAWTLEPEDDEFFTIAGLATSGPDWNGSAMTTDAFPTGVIGDLVFGVEMTNKGASTTYTTHASVGSGTAVAQATALAGASGSQADSAVSVWLGGTGVSFNTSQANGQAYSLGVLVSTPESSIGIPVTIGSGVAAHASVIDADSNRVAPGSIRTFYPGWATISEMDPVAGGTWAHRGDSITLPEMSEYAYDRACMRGFAAIEFSAGRSSDGVWFGIHDDTLARTSENVGLTTNITAMTWADIQTHLNSLNSSGIPRPYYTLDEFLAKYKNHILIVDNKTGASNVSEFLPKLLAVPNATDRIVVKIDGSRVLARFQEAKAAGFKVAGYWYTDGYDTLIPSRAPYTDYIGMEYVATQTVWNAVLAYGKLTWGHVCASQSAYASAISKGAHFVQCSNGQNMIPVR